MQEENLKPIIEIGGKLGLKSESLSLFGKYKAKITKSTINALSKKEKKGKLVLVTAITPTPAGEGKTTVSIGLGQAMEYIGKDTVIALREPSLGPVFGMKGGATGGGVSSVGPMNEINLHFTGDMHAITSANNLMCALIDNHINFSNKLNIDPRRIEFIRSMDMNDRALRNINIGLGGISGGIPREERFSITVASEIMAILCLSNDIDDLKEKISGILVAYTYDRKPVFMKDIGGVGAIASLLKEAIDPNLVQTLENTPAIIHGGPFANIAHGCNSIIATKTALSLGDYCITEAGFGSDLGAEKFLHIKCRKAGLSPSAIVIVATVKALKYSGGNDLKTIGDENITTLKAGLPNLQVHVENMQKFGMSVIVAINKFNTDTDDEINVIKDFCKGLSVKAETITAFSHGGKGGIDLANAVVEACETKSDFKFLYELNASYKEKIETIVREIYRGKSVTYSKKAINRLNNIKKLGFDGLPICIAKTQYSLSDNPKLIGAPKDFEITVTDVKLSAGAGFVVVYCGDIMTMPGLPKVPAAMGMDIDSAGNITGMF